MGWDNNTFPDADTPDDVEWMLISWKIVKKSDCEHCLRGDYGLESRQFDHLGIASSRGEAQAMFQKYVNMHRTRGKNPSRKLYSLFLVEVIDKDHILDITGELIP